MRLNKTGQWLCFSLILFATSVVGFYQATRYFIRAPLQAHELSTPVELPDLKFTLGGPESNEGKLSDFSGKWIALFFGFTHCSEICPTTLGYLKSEYEKLTAKQRAQIQVVFASVDDDNDTPQSCATYAKTFHEDFSCVVFAPEAMTELKKLIGVHFQQSDSEALIHSGEVYLISPDRAWTAYYRPILQTGAMSADIAKLLRSNGIAIF